jgi:hypothetical protein
LCYTLKERNIAGGQESCTPDHVLPALDEIGKKKPEELIKSPDILVDRETED